eukprot:gene6570-9030_t
MGGKNRHSKDRLFITATEWSVEYGGKKTIRNSGVRALPFDHCALSLSPYIDPVLLSRNGVVFDYLNIVPYIQKHRSDPVTGNSVSLRDIKRLNVAKNAEGQWHCPITCKVFTSSSHIVAIWTSGNVYAYDAVSELNIKTKSFVDLISGESFTRADIVTIQDPQNPEHINTRDINNFVHLKQVREEQKETLKGESRLQHNTTSEAVIKEINQLRAAEKESGIKKRTLEDMTSTSFDPLAEEYEDIRSILELQPLTVDINPGQINTDGKAGSSLTSSSAGCFTSSATRKATPEEIREAKWKKMKKLGKKGYVQIQTSMGNLNVELHCDMAMCTSFNFISLCNKGYYDDVIFHRLIPKFMVQTGDPTGTGFSGESTFKAPFKDEFDPRITHNSRGILSMANAGPNSNNSQFFITFKETKHLDMKHSVFGRVVGGMVTLDRIEEVGSNKKDEPLIPIKIIKAVVFTNPIEEAEQLLLEEIKTNIKIRLQNTRQVVLPSSISNSLQIRASTTQNLDPASKKSLLLNKIKEEQETKDSSDKNEERRVKLAKLEK